VTVLLIIPVIWLVLDVAPPEWLRNYSGPAHKGGGHDCGGIAGTGNNVHCCLCRIGSPSLDWTLFFTISDLLV
jgi:hypothetical protein